MKTFKLGQTVMTRGIDIYAKEDSDFVVFILDCMKKYVQCDWGDTCEEDKALNDDAVKNGERILAVYTYPKTQKDIWIITEWDRSVTTILFPEEY